MEKQDEKRKKIFGDKSLTEHLNGYLLAETSILKGISLSKNLTDRAEEMRAVLMSSVGIAVAINRLGKEDMLNETTMLTRALLERLINFCYTVICSDAEFQKYKSYSLQKAYRKLDRKIEAGKHTFGVRYSGEINLDTIPEMKSAVAYFTGPKGGEKTRWTNVELSERVILIGENSKAFDERKWLLSILSFYEDASEALHGTFYGSTFHTGYHQPGFDKNNIEEIETAAQKKLSLLFWQMGDLIGEVIAFLDEKYKLGDIAEKSKENSKNTTEIMKFLLKD